MDESKQNDSGVNIYPERRKRSRSQNEISPFFAHSNTAEKSDEEERPRKPSHRQARLSFHDGHLITRTTLANPDANTERRERLSALAAMTKSLLPGLLATRPDAPPNGYLYKDQLIRPLDQIDCPENFLTQIRVVDADSIDAALDLNPDSEGRPPCILNMANAFSAGGGWMRGSLAQEECLCYRTSLSFTLKLRHYPLPELSAIYSPTVLVIRESMKDGNKLLDVTEPKHLKVVSVVSVAAICQPTLTTKSDGTTAYADSADEKLMQEKIRIILRTVLRNRHRKVVLGAFGCGAFKNPKEKVAEMFATILQESEFQGGWWEEVVFAVLDDGRGNFQTFSRILEGLEV